MKEIKFRYVFKHKKTGDIKFAIISLEYLDSIKSDNENLIADFIDMGYEIIDKNQYTGFKDKNGKEIYEKDICVGLIDGGIDYTHIKFIVEYKMASFVDSYFNHPLMSEKQNLEVIGNIYENPALLREE